MSYPEPNAYGVYSTDDIADYFFFDDKNLMMEGRILQISQYRWIYSASYQIKINGDNSATMGCHSPLKEWAAKKTPQTRSEAIDRMREAMLQYVKTGLSEQHSKIVMRSLLAAERWASSIERQLDLFTA